MKMNELITLNNTIVVSFAEYIIILVDIFIDELDNFSTIIIYLS